MNAIIEVPCSGGVFEGHFPGRPICPGVAELVLILEALARETGRPVSLRELARVRLRQLVLPGDRLELDTRELADGHLRFDLRREQVFVANGELILGAHHEPDTVRESLAAADSPLLSVPSLDALLPQRPPMRFVTSIVGETVDGLAASACIPSACALVSHGSAPALVGLEAAAQTAAAWEALRRWREGGVAAPRVGYLVAMRDVALFADRLPADQTLRTSVRLEAAAPPLTHYRVEVSLEGVTVARGGLATFLTGEGGA